MKLYAGARALATVFVAVIVALGTTGVSASAAPYVVAYHGIDYGMADSGTDLDIWACDGENDSHTMWAEVQTTKLINRYVYDNTADGVCNHSSWSQSVGGYITYLRACEANEGCSEWKWVT
jgi:hypothetical protein